ncbi:MAG: nickel-dependent lactate racemase [Deltaproteobacteria bacterium]|nr:nickel-dependent lactate racemase [Deltaproteobacteria bacterium]
MKSLSIPYGDKILPLQIPEENWGELLAPREVLPVSFQKGLIQAFANPLDSPPLDEFLKGGRSLLILVNDETRPTPSGQVLEFLWPEISAFPKKILVATGTHRPSREEGCRRIFGPLWPEIKDQVFFHDCREERGMVFLGETSWGTRVFVNQRVLMADRLLVIGSVEPHYFAGYTGGRKAIVPGVAAYSSIVANHSLAMDLMASPLRLAGNPVHEDLEEALRLLTVPPIFSLMLVLTPEHRLYAAYSGSIQETLNAAAQRADEVFTLPFQEKADILISVVYPPLDIDLYQSQKPIEHGKMALKEDGLLILVMPCPQGAGSPEFQRLMLQSGDPEKTRLLLYQPYSLGHHRIIRNLKFLEEGGQVWGITALDPHFLSQTFIRPLPSLQEAVDTALVRKGRGAKIHILLNAGLCVPKQD